ncbi:precorrin-3B synthase [Mesorhizobium sp. NBSH29]|uniref:precorrin-3B synthase n=1 Tax=Mesorhizobium sp. NBSH29 TaxID=2654249 RepID=UPI0018968D92|nr:precorrin-3B synthase [Mesorhizobium sp. NBSH29]QPC86648.1 precorrin-3B synthase [Mesorhizobium sp. NBSH29]
MTAIIRNACPSLSEPMRTGDGLLVRLSPASGGFSPGALAGVAQAAFRHGSSMVEVTARGSLQIRGLEESTVAPFAKEIEALGIRVRTGVPVETGPLAGIDVSEITDPLPLAGSIREIIEKKELSLRLGPKVSVVIDGGGRLPMAGILADIRLTATRTKRGVAWQLSIGGTAERAAPIALLDESQARDGAIAALTAIAKLGKQARATHLVPAILRRELTQHALEVSEPDLQQETPLDAKIVFLDRSHLARNSQPIGMFALSANRAAIGVGLPFGQIEGARLAAFCLEAENAGIEEIRLSPGRAILLIAEDISVCEQMRDLAPRFGFIGDAGDTRLCIAACPGSPACSSGHLAARVAGEQLAALGGGLFDNSLSFHVSGCSKGCAHPSAADLTFVGNNDGISLICGGKASESGVLRLEHAEIRHGFARLAGLYREQQRVGETARDCFNRLGAKTVTAAFQGS